MLIRLDGNGLYQENGRDHIFQLKAGQNRRYFTWPIIAQRIEFVFTSGQNTAFGFQVFGGSIKNCRLHEELSGRNWWKLIKVDNRSARPSSIISSYGVLNDHEPQSREINLESFQFVSLQYKNKESLALYGVFYSYIRYIPYDIPHDWELVAIGQKLVDEWDTLGAKRIELNVYQRQGKIYSGNIMYFYMAMSHGP